MLIDDDGEDLQSLAEARERAILKIRGMATLEQVRNPKMSAYAVITDSKGADVMTIPFQTAFPDYLLLLGT